MKDNHSSLNCNLIKIPFVVQLGKEKGSSHISLFPLVKNK